MIWLLTDSSSIGGIERHVATLAQALKRAGETAEVILLADHGDNPWHRQLDAEHVPYRTLDGSFGGLVALMRAERPALLHTHGYKANILGRIAGHFTGTPVAATFHAGERAPFPVSAYQLLDEWTSIGSGRIAVSEAIQRLLPYRSTLVQNFLLLPPAVPAGPLPRKIGFVGRLSHEKGPDRFCELARRARHLGEWHMWGDGPMRAELETAYGGDVVFHGLVTDLADVWASLGLLVMPSRAEGLPMAALEALAAGIPVAASAVGGLPALITPGQTGWLFDGDNLDEMVRAADQWSALDDSRQRDMRSHCWSLVRDAFSEQRQLPKIFEVYGQAGFKRLAGAARSA